MKSPAIISLLLAFFAFIHGSQCQNNESQEILSKIQFDYFAVNDKGMVSNDVSIDYEFCIPMDEAKVAEIKKIEPDVLIPRFAKGRIGCSSEEWLCIVSSNGPKWKERLYAIASLAYVHRIVQTVYE